MLAFGSVAEALDSLLEGDGFEPSVPVAREPVYIAEGELRGDRQKNWRGTDGFARNKFGTSVPLIVGSDNVKIRTNEVTRNNALGVGILQNPLASEDPRIQPNPNDDEVQRNLVVANGAHPSSRLPGVDLF